MPESLGPPSNPPDGERFIVVQYPANAEAHRGVVMRWLRDQIPTAVAVFGGALAFLSVYLAIHQPSEEHRPVWITLSAVCAVLFVAAVWCQNRIAIREKGDAIREKGENSALLKSIADDLAELKRNIKFIPDPEPEPLVATSAEAATVADTQTAALSRDEPDVSLRFQLPNRFELHNYGGDATEVSIARVAIDEYVSDDLGSFEIKTPEQAVQFPVVDLDSGESAPILATHTFWGTPLEKATMAHLFEALIKRRRVDALGVPEREFPQPDSTSERIQEYMRESARLRNEPVDIEMKVAFSNRRTGRKWEKIETLHYEPKTGEARVMHGKPKEVNEYGQELPLLPNLEPLPPFPCFAHSKVGNPAIHLGRGSPDDDNYIAVILPFRNDPPSGGRAGDAIGVKAIIRAGNDRRATGYWVNSDRPEIDIKAGDAARDLVLAYVDTKQDVWVLDDRRPRDIIIENLLYGATTRGSRASIGMSVEMVMGGRSLCSFGYTLRLDDGILSARVIPADA